MATSLFRGKGTEEKQGIGGMDGGMVAAGLTMAESVILGLYARPIPETLGRF
jgi:hypothetical protein